MEKLNVLSKKRENEIDLCIYEKAKKEYEANPISYSHEEIVKMLEENEETREAFAELEEIKKNPRAYKRYSDARKMMQEIFE